MASESSVEAYTRALKMGCKCLECKSHIQLKSLMYGRPWAKQIKFIY